MTKISPKAIPRSKCAVSQSNLCLRRSVTCPRDQIRCKLDTFHIFQTGNRSELENRLSFRTGNKLKLGSSPTKAYSEISLQMLIVRNPPCGRASSGTMHATTAPTWDRRSTSRRRFGMSLHVASDDTTRERKVVRSDDWRNTQNLQWVE